ncbi:MarR family winged helix-turn-helix transcriptional regulator [Lacunimicrobium album]
MPIEPYDFEQSVGFWLTQTTQAYHRIFNDTISPQGITFRQSQVIGWLMKEGQLTQSDLAHRIGVEPPTLVGILDRMERDGWIERVACPEDRRCKRIRIGVKVDQAWQKIVECAVEVRTKSADGLSAEEQNTLKGLLERVYRNLVPTEERQKVAV